MPIRVVCMDDDPDILRLLKIKLTKAGFAVTTAKDGEEGVKTIIEAKPDIIIVDVMMPKKNGYQVLEEVKSKLGKKCPSSILLTAKAEAADLIEGLSHGADDYVTKPFSPSELIERVKVLLVKRGIDINQLP